MRIGETSESLKASIVEVKKIRLSSLKGKYELYSEGTLLMGSNSIPSSYAFGQDPVRRFAQRFFSPRRVMVAGLGMGVTLSAVLAFQYVERVDVVEINQDVIRWNQVHFKATNRGCLNDPRVRVIQEDIGKLLLKPWPKYDLILLDVDNGPHMLARKENESLYRLKGQRFFKDALLQPGLLAVWSAVSDSQFLRYLARVFEEAAEVRVQRKTFTPDYFYLGYALSTGSEGWLVNTWRDVIDIGD